MLQCILKMCIFSSSIICVYITYVTVPRSWFVDIYFHANCLILRTWDFEWENCLKWWNLSEHIFMNTPQWYTIQSKDTNNASKMHFASRKLIFKKNLGYYTPHWPTSWSQNQFSQFRGSQLNIPTCLVEQNFVIGQIYY